MLNYKLHMYVNSMLLYRRRLLQFNHMPLLFHYSKSYRDILNRIYHMTTSYRNYNTAFEMFLFLFKIFTNRIFNKQ